MSTVIANVMAKVEAEVSQLYQVEEVCRQARLLGAPDGARLPDRYRLTVSWAPDPELRMAKMEISPLPLDEI